MRNATLGLAVLAPVALLACGGSSSPSSSQQSEAATVGTYQELSAGVRSAADAYGTNMASPGMTPAGCAPALLAYDALVRPMIVQMVQLGATMDGYIDAAGGMGHADMGCVASAMLSELDAHRAVACTFATVAEDQAEAARHVGAMTSFTGRVDDRCGTMMGRMGGGNAPWGPAWTTCGGAGSGTGGGSPTDALALGKRIFENGIGADGQALLRTGGGMMSGGSMGGCAACHGSDGHGRSLMTFTTPNVTYVNLTSAAGMLEPDGTLGPVYTEDQIRIAVTQGLDPEGATLSSYMPRWQLGDDDWADLLLYLKTLP